MAWEVMDFTISAPNGEYVPIPGPVDNAVRAGRRAQTALEAVADGRRITGGMRAAEAAAPGKFGRFGTPQALAEEFGVRYQAFTDEGYALASRAYERGVLEIPNGMSPRTVIGQRTDAFARDASRDWLAAEGIVEGPGGVIQLNRRLYDTSGTGYRIPDVYIPEANLILDGTIGFKSARTQQVQDFFTYSGGANVVITRPSALTTGSYTGSYGILKPR